MKKTRGQPVIFPLQVRPRLSYMRDLKNLTNEFEDWEGGDKNSRLGTKRKRSLSMRVEALRP